MYLCCFFGQGTKHNLMITETEEACHEILDVNKLFDSVSEVGDWDMLCSRLGVKEETLGSLRFSHEDASSKKLKCLRAYLDLGQGCWEQVVQVLCESPFYKKRLGKKIADMYGVKLENGIC